MKKYMLILCIFLCENTIVKSQIAFGLRENIFGSIEFKMQSNVGVKVEHSIFTEVLKYQHVKMSTFYKGSVLKNRMNLNMEPYYGITYARTFYEYGILSGLKINLRPKFVVECIVNPRYDSYYEWDFCYQVGVGGYFVNGIGFFTQYTTIPVYRTRENRLNFGIHIKEGTLDVFPMLTMPLEWNVKHMRANVSVSYTIKNKVLDEN